MGGNPELDSKGNPSDCCDCHNERKGPDSIDRRRERRYTDNGICGCQTPPLLQRRKCTAG